MQSPWQPSQNARLTLKQFGLSADQIQEALATFRLEDCEQTDLAFMRFARHGAASPALEQRLTEMLELALDWQPSQKIQQQLEAAGFQPTAIEHYRTLFVVSAREQGRPLRDPDKAFLAFCRHRATTLPAPMPAGWLPRTETLQQLVREKKLDGDRIPALIERFIHIYQSRLSPDWDRTFATWLERGRAERGEVPHAERPVA